MAWLVLEHSLLHIARCQAGFLELTPHSGCSERGVESSEQQGQAGCELPVSGAFGPEVPGAREACGRSLGGPIGGCTGPSGSWSKATPEDRSPHEKQLPR